MNHRPFEDWLLENQPLNPEQKLELLTHLKSCTTCTALSEVNLALRSPRMVTAPPGFTVRFQGRLEAERTKRHFRQVLGLGSLGFLVFLMLVVAVFVLFTVLLGSPGQILINWLNWWISLVASVRTYGSVGLVLLRTAAGIIPLPLWLGITSASFLLISIWVTSLWKLSYSSHARRLE